MPKSKQHQANFFIGRATPYFFNVIANSSLTYWVVKNTTNVKPGDYVDLLQIDPETKEETGVYEVLRINRILPGVLANRTSDYVIIVIETLPF